MIDFVPLCSRERGSLFTALFNRLKRRRWAPAFAGALALASPAMAQVDEGDAPYTGPTVEQILAAAPAETWRDIAVEDLYILTLPPAADGVKRQVVIQLLPKDYATGHVRNVAKMATARWYDGTKIYRVAPNFVTQFGGNADNKPPIKGLEKPPASEFLNPALGAIADADRAALDTALTAANAERKDEDKLPSFASLLWDPYQVKASYAAGWPLGQKEGNSFLIHCRGTVSVPHYDPPDTGTGTELSVITGEASRNLDAAYGVVGRVIDGLQHLIDLPPGDEGGFYANKARNIPIASLRPATSLPEADQPAYQYLDSTSVVVVQAMQAHSKVTGQWRDSICAYPMLVRRTPPGE